MLQRNFYRVWAAAAASALMVGCEQPTPEAGPSYAELIVTYNAELEALDRLEAKRSQLVREFVAVSAPAASGNTRAKLEALLKSAHDLKEGTDVDTTADPEAMLDSLTKRSGEAQEIADQLLGGLFGSEPGATDSEPSPEEEAAAVERTAAFEAERAKLDAEITKQKARVERARRARDAADEISQSQK